MEEDYNELIYLLKYSLVINRPKQAKRLLNVIYNSTQKAVYKNKFNLFKEWEKYLDPNNPITNEKLKDYPEQASKEPFIPNYIQNFYDYLEEIIPTKPKTKKNE